MRKLTWLGHSAFLLEIGNKRIAFDPWLKGNPKAPISLGEFEGADVYLITHDHGDHGLEDAIQLSKEKGGTVVGIVELSDYAEERGAEAVGANVGGLFEVHGIEIALTQAVHSSTIGVPVGFIVKAGGLTLYHAGDTGLFPGMALIGEFFSPRVVMVPIGGYYTMGPFQAAKCIELLGAERAIPMHWGTFPVLKGTPEELKERIRMTGLDVEVVKLLPGESAEI